LALTAKFRNVIGEAVYRHPGNKNLDSVFPGQELGDGFLKLLG